MPKKSFKVRRRTVLLAETKRGVRITMKEMSLTHLSVFSGIGGIDIAGEWAGFHTIGQVELADYPFRGALQALAGCAEVERCL
jgi:hypothetical protein